jgi:hypothetical protein
MKVWIELNCSGYSQLKAFPFFIWLFNITVSIKNTQHWMTEFEGT